MSDTTISDTGSGSDWYGQDAATFGDRVAAARDAAGLTQKELARRIGVKLATVQGWEDDRSEPRANRLSMMAGIMNVSMMWLINGEGEGLPDPEGEDTMQDDARALMSSMRAMRADMLARAAQMGVMEKRLRQIMKDYGDKDARDT